MKLRALFWPRIASVITGGYRFPKRPAALLAAPPTKRIIKKINIRRAPSSRNPTTKGSGIGGLIAPLRGKITVRGVGGAVVFARLVTVHYRGPLWGRSTSITLLQKLWDKKVGKGGRGVRTNEPSLSQVIYTQDN